MAENKLSYLKRNFDEYKEGLIEITRQYYPDVFANMNDASVGEWLIELLADIGDNLNYHIDRSVQETTLESAREFSSVQDLARTNGLKIPYKKAALVEVELSCTLPVTDKNDGNIGTAEEEYCPIIKKGTKFSNGVTTFELNEDVDFSEQFNADGISNRKRMPLRNSNGIIVKYTYTKLATASACQTKIFKKVISNSDIKPFMDVTIGDSDVIGVESILVRDGSAVNTDPELADFYVEKDKFTTNRGIEYKRFFEVENLIDQNRFSYEVDEKNQYIPSWVEEYVEDGDEAVLVKRIAKGKWQPLKQKFITEYTNDWKLKVIFGAGLEDTNGTIPNNASDFVQYQMSKMIANDYMGVLPKPGSTMWILYRTGGGEISNIPANTLTNIVSLDVTICGNDATKIRETRQSIKVTNTTPSYGGKDAPTMEEIKYMIKYNNSAQNRCVTLKDYASRINQIPAKFGCPFRHSVIEENNKVLIYMLGLDADAKLMKEMSETVAENVKEYLSQYRMLNDFVEIRSGKIVNLGFRLTIYIDKAYDKSETAKRVIDTVYDYMDIRKHLMGEDIFLGDMEKEVSKLDGVINVVDIQVFNKTGGDYSEDEVTQLMLDPNSCCYSSEGEQMDVPDNEIDLKASDYILFSEANSMFEIKNKEKDISVLIKTR